MEVLDATIPFFATLRLKESVPMFASEDQLLENEFLETADTLLAGTVITAYAPKITLPSASLRGENVSNVVFMSAYTVNMTGTGPTFTSGLVAVAWDGRDDICELVTGQGLLAT